MKHRLSLWLEYLGAAIIGTLLLTFGAAFFVGWFAFRHARWLIIVLALLLSLVALASAQGASGMVLRGTLDNASSDGYPYWKIGEAFIITVPKDSALIPGIRALEGKKVVITILEDR